MRPPFFDVRLFCWRDYMGGNRESGIERPTAPSPVPITRSPFTRLITRSPDHPIADNRAARARSNSSRPSETDGDFAALDDDRNFPTAGEANHPIELLDVVLDVDIDEGHPALSVVLTGRCRVGSGVLSSNLDAASFHAHLRRDGTAEKTRPECYDFDCSR